MDGIFLGEADGVRTFEGVKVCEEGVDQGGGRSATKEEGRLCIFYWEGLLFCEGALGAGILGLTRKATGQCALSRLEDSG